jgi:signal transduction histidine kinase
VRLGSALLVLARIQSGRELPRLDLVQLRPLLAEVAATVTPHEHVAIDVKAPEDVAALTSRDLLRLTLENIATNAAKHTREGTIVLEARALGRTVEVEVADTGPGMEATEAAHAFDRFYRSTEWERDGFGLGLAIAQETIRALGGTITLDSAPGIGTIVRIRIPSATIIS